MRIWENKNKDMITLNIEYRIRAGKEAEFLRLMKELALASRQDKGCVRYQYYLHPEDSCRVMLWEEWESQAMLGLHGQQEHFLRIVPQIRAISEAEKHCFQYA